MIWIHSQAERSVALPESETGPPSPPAFEFSIQIAGRRQVPAIGGRWRTQNRPWGRPPFQLRGPAWTVESSFVRLPTWLLVILLMVPPIRRSLFERKRARRMSRNECLACGYSLIGLLEPRCPECGVGFTRSPA